MSVQHEDPTHGRWWEIWDGVQQRDAPTRWTDWQSRVLESPYHLSINWGPNGIGKSLVMAEKARRALSKDLAWQRSDRQVVILAGKTWSQLGSTMRYFFEGVPAGWFRPGVRYESGGVKGQRLAVYDVVGGPGKGNELRLGTFNAENLAGPRASWAGSDEPLPEDVYNELWPRLFGRGGRMDMFFTTTLRTSAKMEYIWEKVDDEGIPWAGQIHTALDLAAVTPRGGLVDLPWVSQAEIDRFESGLSAIERDMRMGRSRHPRTDAAYFSAWGRHLRQTWRPPVGARIAVGIDHGSKPGAQRASLIYSDGRLRAPRIHVAAHYKADGRTEMEADAAGIIAMIERAGHKVEDVDLWIGDRSHGGDKWGGVKSNVRLQRAIAAAMGIDVNRRRHLWLPELPDPLARLGKPRKYDGSVWDGCEELHRLMVSERLTVAEGEDCDALDEDLRTWQARMTDPAKDGIDSMRYPIVALLDERRAA